MKCFAYPGYRCFVCFASDPAVAVVMPHHKFVTRRVVGKCGHPLPPVPDSDGGQPTGPPDFVCARTTSQADADFEIFARAMNCERQNLGERILYPEYEETP